MTPSDKFAVSVASIPVLFTIERFFSILFWQMDKALVRFDPDFPHTFGQMLCKSLLDTVDFILFGAFFLSVLWAVSCFLECSGEKRENQNATK